MLIKIKAQTNTNNNNNKKKLKLKKPLVVHIMFSLFLSLFLIHFVVSASIGSICQGITIRQCPGAFKPNQLQIEKCLAHLTPKDLSESDWFAQIGGILTSSTLTFGLYLF
jgi:hypothetical protein